MIFTKHLLSQFVDISHIQFDKLCTLLSNIGLEVESAYEIRIPQKVVVGKVRSCNAHPDADKLSVCCVDIGSEELQIVCGAPNVKAEQYVAVALVGAVIPHTKNGELVIQKATLRGVESCGMLCSSTELGLPKINNGIMVLDNTAGELILGKEVGELALFDDYVIEVNITPNRGDCLSVLGIAREIAAYYNLRLKTEIDMDNVVTLGLGRVLRILTNEKIDAYLLYRVVEIKQAYLPLDIALTLARNGTLVDDIVCNFLEYTTYMTGVIVNAYKMQDCIDKENALDDSPVAQLSIKKDENGLEAVFAHEKLSILGTTYGDRHFGTRSEVLILEASYVNPIHIAKKLYEDKIKGDASLTYRSTRGSNPYLEQGIDFLCKKLMCASNVLVYSGSHSIIQHTDEMMIRTTFSAINKIIGIELKREEIASILKSLSFRLEVTGDENFFMIVVPSYRHDIQSIQDVAEEVLRIYGIDNLMPAPLPHLQACNISQAYFTYRNTRNLAHNFIANAFNECIHYVFASSQSLENLGFTQIDENLALLNPITQELDTLRTSLLPALLDSVKRNENLGFKSIALFETGSVYNIKREEKNKLAFVVSGLSKDECYPHTKATTWDFFSFALVCQKCIGEISLKNIRDVEDSQTLLAEFGLRDDRILHPYQSAFVYQDNKPIGIIAKLHPQITTQLDISETFICEINLCLNNMALTQAKDFSKYQKSTRDLTILIDKQIPFYRVREAITQAQIDFVQNVYPLDVYYNESLGKQMALSIRLVLQSYEDTLQESQLNNATQAVLKILQDSFQATLRA